jgi:hypothetical protein
MNYQPDDTWDPFKFSNNQEEYVKPEEFSTLNYGGTTYWAPQTQAVESLQVDPIMNEEVFYPNYEYTYWRNPNSALAAEGELECARAFPGKVVDQSSIGSKELMGLNMAQETVKPAGAGEAAHAWVAPIPVTAVLPDMGMRLHRGLAYEDTAGDNVYAQNFMSMAGVPTVSVGTWTNPYTGVEYEAYESALPPPDADYVEMTHSSAKNMALGLLQGGSAGFSNDTPEVEKREVLEDNFHMHADFTINQYGGGGSWQDALQARAYAGAERNMRFTHNDERPDGEDGPELLDHIPANRDGIYNEKIRFVPRLQHTNRGKQEEVMFRTGPGPMPQGMHDNHVAQIYTHFPQELPDIERQGGPVNGFQGVMAPTDYSQTFDSVVPQRDATEETAQGHVQGAATFLSDGSTAQAQYAQTFDAVVPQRDATEETAQGHVQGAATFLSDGSTAQAQYAQTFDAVVPQRDATEETAQAHVQGLNTFLSDGSAAQAQYSQTFDAVVPQRDATEITAQGHVQGLNTFLSDGSVAQAQYSQTFDAVVPQRDATEGMMDTVAFGKNRAYAQGDLQRPEVSNQKMPLRSTYALKTTTDVGQVLDLGDKVYAPRSREVMLEPTTAWRDTKASDYEGQKVLATGGGGDMNRGEIAPSLAWRDTKASDYKGQKALATGGGGDMKRGEVAPTMAWRDTKAADYTGGATQATGGAAQMLGVGSQNLTRQARLELLMRMAGLSKTGETTFAQRSREILTHLKDTKGAQTNYTGPRAPYAGTSNMEGAVPGLVRQNGKHRPSVPYYGNPGEYANNAVGIMYPSTQLTEEYENFRVPNMEMPVYVGPSGAQAFTELTPQPCAVVF